MHIFMKDIEEIIKNNSLQALSDCLLSVYLNHCNSGDRTEIHNTNKNTLYLCDMLKIEHKTNKKMLCGEDIKSYFEKLNIKGKDLIFILGNPNIIEEYGFKIISTPYFEIISNQNDDDFSTPFDLIPTNNLDSFIDDSENVCL